MVYSHELLAVAKRICCFGTPEEAPEFPIRFLTYAMTYASDGDIEILLRGLSESVLRTEVIDYAVSRVEEALRKRCEELDAELEQVRQRKQQIEAEIARLIQAIADGQGSQSIMAAIGERERELRTITDKLLEPRPGSLSSTL